MDIDDAVLTQLTNDLGDLITRQSNECNMTTRHIDDSRHLVKLSRHNKKNYYSLIIDTIERGTYRAYSDIDYNKSNAVLEYFITQKFANIDSFRVKSYLREFTSQWWYDVDLLRMRPAKLVEYLKLVHNLPKQVILRFMLFRDLIIKYVKEYRRTAIILPVLIKEQIQTSEKVILDELFQYLDRKTLKIKFRNCRLKDDYDEIINWLT